MNMTKANIVKVLQAMADNDYSVYLSFKDDDEVMAEKMLASSSALNSAVRLMTNKRYFENIAKIFFPEEE